MPLTKSGSGRKAAALLCVAMALSPIPEAHAATIEYTVTASRVNIRKETSTSSGVVTVLNQGETLLLISSTADGWLQVNTSAGTGYLSAEYACLTSLSGSDATATVLADKLNIRSDASSSSKAFAVARKGSRLDVLGLTDGWLKIRYEGEVGYVSPSYVTLDAGSSNVSVPSQSGTSDKTETSTVLQKGDKGDAVKSLQEKLVALGYLSGSADGKYGSDTRDAVKAFQRSHNLNADGVAGPSTLAALESAVSASAPSQPEASDKTETSTVLQKGDKGDAVKSLQEKLVALGYLSGSADGKYGSDTRDAVKAFQRNHNLDADGVAGPSTLAALESVTITAPSDPAAPDVSAPVVNSLLKKGSTGDAVKSLQEKLVALGYLSGPADGKYGSDTVAAVKAFQRDNGLTIDGMAGTLTLSALSSASGTTSGDNPTGATLLKYGDAGDAVVQLQTRLKELGYFTGSIGGNFGSITRDAVKAFQTAANLTADGIAGEATLTALYAADAPKKTVVTLRAGDTGEAVIRLQTRLKELGYLSGTVDGEFGSVTQAAVMAFQSAAGLSSDGIAGTNTLNALYSDGAPAASSGSNSNDTASAVADKIIETAKKYLGCKYVYAKESPPYFDCSGLTYYVFKQYGYTLLRTAYQQGYNSKYQKLSYSQLKKGDLVFFNTNATDSDMCDHVGIYIGDGQFIHASSSAGKVVINDLTSGYYNRVFSWGRRILE